MSQPINENSVRPERSAAGPLKTLLVSALIVVVGAALVWLIYETEPTATRKETARETAMLVDVQPVRRGRFTPTFEALGLVMPAREITLGSRVSGQVIEQSEFFTPGRRVQAGEELISIDPADYQVALQQRRSELQQAQANLELEQGQQAVARQEFRLIGKDIDAANRALILREPQLKQAKAQVAIAQAAVHQAELALERTHIRAPFPAQVLSREISVGSQVSPGQALGRLVGTQTYWVEATVPLSRLQWMDFNQTEEFSGTPVRLYNDSVWTTGQSRKGRLSELLGELDNNARMARVLITVEDPLALKEATGQPPLILGTFVRAEIPGKAITNVVRLERRLIRRNKTVWVMSDQKLEIRQVEIVLQDNEYAYVRSGLEDGDLVITSDLASVVDGADLRLEKDKDE